MALVAAGRVEMLGRALGHFIFSLVGLKRIFKSFKSTT